MTSRIAQQLAGAPAEVIAAMERLQQELAAAAGNNLAGLLVYGGLARGRYRAGRSDINVLVLLHDAAAESLQAIARPLRAAARAVGVDPLLLTPAEIPRAAAAFPTKLLDIQKHHLVLAGSSAALDTLVVSREQIRQRAAQELNNLLLRLRHRLVATAGDPRLLAEVLARAARPLALELAALLQAAGREVPADDRTPVVFAAAAAAFDLAPEPLAQLAELRHQARPAGNVAELFRGVLAVVGRAVDVAERLPEANG